MRKAIWTAFWDTEKALIVSGLFVLVLEAMVEFRRVATSLALV